MAAFITMPSTRAFAGERRRASAAKAAAFKKTRVSRKAITELKKRARAAKRPKKHKKIGSRLHKIISSAESYDTPQAPPSAPSKKIKPGARKIKVIFNLKDKRIDIGRLKSRGASNVKIRGDLLTAEMPPEKIEEVVDSVKSIKHARTPQKFFAFGDPVTSEGVALTGANTLQLAGFTGQGVKIGIIDIGFKGLSAAIANESLPAGLKTVNFTVDGIEAEYKHGTACAEIVYDMAPGAAFYLIKVADEIDFYDAIDYCKNAGIDIISSSIGTMGSGPGDGTGPVCAAMDTARTSGILGVNASGNNGTDTSGSVTVGFHWKGAFRDTNNDLMHEFNTTDNQSIANVVVATPSHDDDGNSLNDDLTVILRWDDWPSANVDYDLYLYDENYILVASSTGTQNGSQPPLEKIIYDVPDSSTSGEQYFLMVERVAGEPTGVDIELFATGSTCFVTYYSAVSSIIEPADAASVLTASAIDRNKWAIGPQEEFSSQGPTNAWAGSTARIKPDICGPDMVSTSVYSPSVFAGTSAATPHAAGAAAVILSMHPHYGPDQLQNAIESSATDTGSAGKDNIYGSGRINLPMASLNNKPVLDWAGEANYVSDGLNPETGYSTTNFVFKIKYTDADGDAPAISRLYLDKNGDGDYIDLDEQADMSKASGTYAGGAIYIYNTTIPFSATSQNCSYYFSFSDGIASATGNIAQAISSATALNTPNVLQTLGINVDKNTWNISPTPIQIPAAPLVMAAQNRIKVTNAGDGAQTYNLKIDDDDSKNEWAHGTTEAGSALNTYILSGLFSGQADTVVPASFNEGTNDDILTGSTRAASSTGFAFGSGSQDGAGITQGSEVYLYFRLDLPAAVSGDNFDKSHDITVELGCQAG